MADKERKMTNRVKKMMDFVRAPKIVFSVTKATIFTEAYQKYEGDPNVIRMAKAQAEVLDKIPIFILEGELIAGAPASKPMAVEADFWTKGTWQKEGIDSLRQEEYAISEEEAQKMIELTEYWHKIIPEYKLYDLYDDPMWAWKRSGYLLPVNRTLEEAAGMGYACNGMDILPEADTYQVDYGYVIGRGLQPIIDEAKTELSKITSMSIRTEDDIERIYVLRAMIIINEAVIRWVGRYAELAEKLASETTDEKRRQELLSMADTCRRIPAKPAETFRDALQFQWFLFLMISCQTTTPLGRMDQYLYPYYKHDIEAGLIDDEQVLEYLELYRLKFLQMKNTSGGQSRLKWSGQARWNSVTLGGVDSQGKDATNELSYLFLEAAYRCRVPHHTLHVRVHPGTPEKLMQKSIELVRTGMGMPSFLSDASYIGNLVDNGVPLEVARQYYIIGCVDVTVPEGWGMVFSMVVTALALDTFMHNGYSKQQKMMIGPQTGDVREMKTYQEFEDKLIEHADNQPKLETITFRFISESSVALIELQNGNVDFIFDPSGVEYNDVAAGGYEELIAVECESMACQTIFFNVTGVLSDIRLRQAICYAIDNESINLSVFEGVGCGATSVIPSGMWAYDENMANYYEYNPDKAKELLAEAGYADGLTVSMVCASTAAFKGISEMMLSQLNEVGITLEIEYADNATATSLSQDSSDYDISIRQAGFTEEPHGGLAKYMLSSKGVNGGTNLSKTAGLAEAEALDAILDRIITINDKDERKAAYAELQEAYYDQAYGYAIQENVDVYCLNSNLKGVVRMSGYLNFQYCYFD